MFKRVLQVLGIFLLACGASAALMFVLTLGARTLVNLGREPQYYLPAEHTVFYVQQPTEELIDVLSTLFPETPLPEDTGYALAGIRTEDGNIGTIVFTESSEPSMGRFALKASDEKVRETLETLPTLASDETFSNLQKSSKDSWLYTEAQQLSDRSLHSAFWNEIAFSEATHIVIDRLEKGWHIAIAGPTTPQKTMQTLRIPALDGVHAFAIGSPAALWTNMLSEDAEIGLHTTLRTTVQAAVGTDVSPLYDLLPLLQKPVTVHLSGSTVALQGNAKKEDIQNVLGKLSKSFENIEPETNIETLQLDNRFSSTNIRLSTLNAEEIDRNGWIIRTKRHGPDGAIFTSAVRGSDFILSTSTTLMHLLTDEMPSLAVPLPSSLAQTLPRAAGRMHKEYLPSFVTPLHTSKDILWSLTERPNRRDLLLFEEEPTENTEM